MAFKIRLYTHAKRNNSTKQPIGNGREFDCVIKRESGILHPMIELDIGLAEDPSQYNYAYIPVYDRYYYIEEWTNANPLWNASLKVDALSSWKSTIGNTDLYVLRASQEYDGNVIDTFYPTKTNCTTSYKMGYSPFNPAEHSGEGINVSDGCFIVGISSKYGLYGSVRYYAMNMSSLSTLCTKLMENGVTELNDFDPNDCSLELQKALIDPLQYIKSCIWMPFGLHNISGQSVSSLTIYNWTFDGVSAIAISDYAYRGFTSSFTLDKHPQTSARGNFVNTAPYTLNTLFFAPFGTIELDTTLTANDTSITCRIIVDYVGGKGVLLININGIVSNRITSQVGVPIQLSQVVSDYLTAAQSVVNNGANMIDNILHGSIGGAVASGFNTIADATRALAPRSSTMGSNGSFADIWGKPYLYQQFFPLVDDDIDHNGRPLCKIRKPSALGGYMLIQDGDVAFAGTSAEIQEVKQYLESGFYYE